MECWIWDWIEMNRMNYKEMGWIGLDGIGWGWIERIIKELDELLRNGMECLIWDWNAMEWIERIVKEWDGMLNMGLQCFGSISFWCGSGSGSGLWYGSGSGSEVTFDSVNRIFPIKCYARL